MLTATAVIFVAAFVGMFLYLTIGEAKHQDYVERVQRRLSS